MSRVMNLRSARVGVPAQAAVSHRHIRVRLSTSREPGSGSGRRSEHGGNAAQARGCHGARSSMAPGEGLLDREYSSASVIRAPIALGHLG